MRSATLAVVPALLCSALAKPATLARSKSRNAVAGASQSARAGRSLLPLAACLLLPAAAAAEGLSTDKWFYEIDADYGSQIADTVPSDAGQPAAPEISDGGVTTWGNRENCGNWEHTDRAPYMGHRAYTVRCAVNLLTDSLLPPRRHRSEQHFVQGWRTLASRTFEPVGARSLTMAFRLSDVPATPTSNGGGWIAQMHGEGLPFNLVWVATTVAKPLEGMPEPGYYLWAGAKYDEKNKDTGEYETRQPYRTLGRLMPDAWNRLLIQIDFGRGHHQCRGSIGLDAFWTVARMDNATGLWGEPLRYPFTPDTRMGNPIYVWNGDQPYQRVGRCLHPNDQNYNFKIGHYVVATTHSLDYDNITYGKRWINITKNHLIGYHKSVLFLPFEETSTQAITNRVEDRSYTWNGGSANDPTANYDNDGVIVGQVARITDREKGRVLRFPGAGYVKVPIGPNTVDDFDVGNYMTVSAWFRTGAKPPENKGLVMIDEFSDTWKLLLYMRGNGMAFGVRHPGTYSRLDHVFPMGQYADSEWHLVTGTYNRFDPSCQIAPRSTGAYRNFAFKCERIKLYIDGKKVMGAEGADLPILRGENQLVVGKYSVGGFFQGDIDDVGLFNYTMTDADVQNLWRKRGAS